MTQDQVRDLMNDAEYADYAGTDSAGLFSTVKVLADEVFRLRALLLRTIDRALIDGNYDPRQPSMQRK